MIIQTAPERQPRLAVMMYEHTAIARHFAGACGNERIGSRIGQASAWNARKPHVFQRSATGLHVKKLDLP
jgi:hypothetical protein